VNADTGLHPIDASMLTKALAETDPHLLLMLLVQLTGDTALLDEFRPFIKKIKEQLPGDIPADKVAALRSRLVDVLTKLRAAPARDEAVAAKIIGTMMGEPVPGEYVPMILEFAGVIPAKEEKPVAEANFRVAIIGSGLLGIAAAVYLQKAGIDFVIIEKTGAPGGTWNDNRYPGCGVDTASHFYTYSFAPNPDWEHFFATRNEISKYIANCVKRFGLDKKTILNTDVNAARYDDKTRTWSVELRDANGKEETLRVNAVISAVGQLNLPYKPKIAGLDTFGGTIAHTARWPKDLDYTGKRVALIGAGSSGLQVGPTVAPVVKRLTVFQRSPQWFGSRVNYHGEVSENQRWAFRNIPFYWEWYRARLIWSFGDGLWPALYADTKPEPGVNVSRANDDLRVMWTAYIRDKLKNRPDLIEKLTPSYPPLTKRPPVDNGWFEMLQRDNVDLVMSEIDHVEPGKIVARDGTSHDADIIVLATGFEASRMLQTVQVTGRGGHDIRELWGEDNPRAFLGITVPGFPNFFVMYGPNTNLGHGGNIIFHGECQANYVVSCLRYMKAQGRDAIEVTQQAFDRYVAEVDERIGRSVWNTPGVSSWFKNSKGRVTTNSPWRLVEYWNMTRQIDPADYQLS
jgi:4-hydroxyacetophenone monooxygenase